MDIIKLKAEMFDIIREQERIKKRLGALQNALLEKEKTLISLEKPANIKIGDVIK